MLLNFVIKVELYINSTHKVYFFAETFKGTFKNIIHSYTVFSEELF